MKDKLDKNIKGMTIEEIFRKGEISILIRNICMANEIKTLGDLKLHYNKSKGFKNLLYCDMKSNKELIAVYKKYKDVYIEAETSQPVSVEGSKSELVNVVTDLDEVIKTTDTADVSFEEIEQMLKDHWEKKGIRSVQSEPYVSRNTKSFEEIEQMLKDHWEKKGIRSVQSEPCVGKATELLEELEQRLKNHWREKVIEITEKKVTKSKSPFGRHPSKKLNALYDMKSYQGANPIDAKVIFVGRDPNWAADIEETDMFGSVVEYLTDGISFWEKYAIHHPFLLKSYRGDGKKYHRVFSKMNLDSSMASKISFVELMGFPTTGMAGSNVQLFREYLFSDENKDNLRLLDKVLNDPSKIIFIARGLITNFKAIYNKTGLLKRFAEIDKSRMDRKHLNRVGNIYIHTHFSDAISSETIKKMEDEVRSQLM